MLPGRLQLIAALFRAKETFALVRRTATMEAPRHFMRRDDQISRLFRGRTESEACQTLFGIFCILKKRAKTDEQKQTKTNFRIGATSGGLFGAPKGLSALRRGSAYATPLGEYPKGSAAFLSLFFRTEKT